MNAARANPEAAVAKGGAWRLWLPFLLVCLLLAYFQSKNEDAFQVSLVLIPIWTALGYGAWKSGTRVLIFLMGFVFLSHGLAPGFFFIAQDNYTQSGSFGAVGSFNFGAAEFLGIYMEMFILVALIVFFTAIMCRMFLPGVPSRKISPALERDTRPGGSAEALALVAFVVLVGVPVSAFMYEYKIGFTGIVSQPMPYRITGILYYARMFIFPAVVFWLYSRSGRGKATTTIVIAYAVIASFASVSRYQLLISSLPVFAFAFLDKKPLRLVVLGSVVLVCFALVSASRELVYAGVDLSLTELVVQVIQLYSFGEFSPIEVVGGIVNRLWGPQDVVLASQYIIPDPLTAIIAYFRIQPVISDLTYELYGMVFPEGYGFGVGIGVLPWMIMLASGNVAILAGLAFILSILLSMTEFLTRQYLRLGPPLDRVAYPLAFMSVYVFYSSTLNWMYQLLIVSSIPLIYLSLRRRSAQRARNQTTPSLPAERAV